MNITDRLPDRICEVWVQDHSGWWKQSMHDCLDDAIERGEWKAK